jgi:hypothetical protein
MLLVVTKRKLKMTKTVMVGELEAGRSAKVKAALETLIENMQRSNFDLAEILHEVKTKKYYHSWGFSTFREYLNTLNLKVPKANYLVRMIEVTSHPDVGKVRAEYEPVGISKLREITSLDPAGVYLNPETGCKEELSFHIRALIENGIHLSLGEIRDTVKHLKGLEGEDELVWLNVRLKKTVLESIVKPSLVLAKRVIGSKGRDDDGMAIEASDGAALECIAASYLIDPNNNAIADGMPITEEE